MKPIFKFCLIFVFVISYIISINILADLVSISSNNYEIHTNNQIGGTTVQIGVGQSVSVSVTRKPHFYGRFSVNDGKEYLNFFYICNLPWKIKTYNFWIFHIIFLVTLSLFILLIFTKKVYKGGNLNLEDENLVKNTIDSK